MNGEKTANGTNLVINGANGDDTKVFSFHL